jgi:predicted 3-demethylubiquinone-9 3-methyltransferase (glyoxalase superfamily)
VTLLPDIHVDNVWRSPAETPSGPAGMVLTVDFTVAGQQFQGLNGGAEFRFAESVSFVIDCEDQAEVDRLWESLTANGGEPGPCGWLKDRFGLSWQIVPRRLGELVNDPDPERARRAMEAMLKMDKIEVAELERAADAA